MRIYRIAEDTVPKFNTDKDEFLLTSPKIGDIDPESGFRIEQYDGSSGELIPAYNLLEVFQKQKYAYIPVSTSHIDFTPTKINYLDITPTQLHVSYEYAQKYRNDPPFDLPKVLFVKKYNKFFAMDHTRIVSQILNGKKDVDVQLGTWRAWSS